MAEKVEKRDKLARKLEGAETKLIKKCKAKHTKLEKIESKKNKGIEANKNGVSLETENGGPGISSGIPHTSSEMQKAQESQRKKRSLLHIPIPNIVPLPIGKVVGEVKGLGVDVKDNVRGFGDKIGNALPDPDRLGYDPNISDDDTKDGGRGISSGEPDHDREDARTGYASGKANVPRRDDDTQEPHHHRPESLSSSPIDGPYQSHSNEPARVNATDSSIPSRTKSLLKGATAIPTWKAWANAKKSAYGGSPQAEESDSLPLSTQTPRPEQPRDAPRPTELKKEEVEYPPAFSANTLEDEENGEPVWKQYIKESERATMKIPNFKFSFLNFLTFLPFVGTKVDTIYYCRREVARLTVEIESDQERPESFPLMNSVFIQFQSQVAAHMACQALNHHVPQHMAPRYLEVNPNDVIWHNMRLKWWERYIRFGIITAIVAGSIIGWAFPVAVVGALSNIAYLTSTYHWLAWLNNVPQYAIGFVTGVLPPALMGLLLFLLPGYLRCTFPTINF